MSELSSICKIIDREILKIFGGLQLEGFSYRNAVIHRTAAIGEYIEATFEKRGDGKKLKFWYAPEADGRSDCVSLFFEKGATDSFSLDEYLAHNKYPEASSAILDFSTYRGTIQDRIGAYLEAARGVIFDRLSLVLLGDEWQHIPVDWEGLK